MEKTFEEAIILRTKNIGEYNKLVFLFTRSRGKIKAVAYGARKIKNRFGSALEPFTYGKVLLIEKKGTAGVSLDQVEIIQSSFDLYSDYVVAAHLYYYSELLDFILPEEHPEGNIFRLALEMLKGFQLKLSPARVASYFEVWLLRLLGHLPDHSRCNHCRRTLKGNKEVYIAREGYLFCGDCRIKGLDDGKKEEQPIYHTLNLILKNRINSEKLNSIKLANNAVIEWTTQLIKNRTNKEMKSYKNLREIRNF
jgi:DNA repair protein RecO (recombination protein O)